MAPHQIAPMKRKVMPIRALAPIPKDYDLTQGPQVICPMAEPLRGVKRAEPAGRAFKETYEQRKAKKAAATEEPASGAVEPPTPPPGGESGDEDEGSKKWGKRKKAKTDKITGNALRLPDTVKDEDLYALLELDPGCGQDAVKKQYRKMALKLHPDKARKQDADEEEDKGLSEEEVKFVKLQEAYNVLSDEKLRRKYDSSRDFDDDVPDSAEPDEFFEIYLPVFERNCIWSVKRPVPKLGDADTPMKDVHRFYEFWFNKWESWRDFSQHDEYDLADAECREERRWCERQNAKIRRKHQNTENARILKLVEGANKCDPRMIAERLAENKERDDAKANKERAAREKKEAEVAAKRAVIEAEESQKKAKADADAEAKKKRDGLKLILKEGRSRVRQECIARAVFDSVDSQVVSELLLTQSADQLASLGDRLCALPQGKTGKPHEDAAAIIRTLLDDGLQASQKEAEAAQALAVEREKKRKEAEKEAAESAKKGKEWSADELVHLAKGLQKFPGGVGRRWDMITMYLCEQGGKRSRLEVINKTKEVSESTALKLGGGLQESDAFVRFQSGLTAKGAGSGTAKEVEADTRDVADNTAAPVEEPEAAVEEDVWAGEQQKALEGALANNPASKYAIPAERWEVIAKLVPGKTKKQCVARFKFLREQVQAARK